MFDVLGQLGTGGLAMMQFLAETAHAVATTAPAEGFKATWVYEILVAPKPGAMMTAHTVLVLGAVVALGLWLGSIKVGGISLGIGGVLFSGLALSHFGFNIDEHTLEFVREFGLMLFVYTIGLQVGPGIIASLRKHGLPLNILAATTVMLGVAVTLAIVCVSRYLPRNEIPLPGFVASIVNWNAANPIKDDPKLVVGGNIDYPAAVGLLSGATTNTPSLSSAASAMSDKIALATAAAAQAPVVTLPHSPTTDPASAPGVALTTQSAASQPVVATVKPIAKAVEVKATQGGAYALAYPFGILGIILTMLIIRKFFKVDIHKENEAALAAHKGAHALLGVNVEVTNPNLEGMRIATVPMLDENEVVISRVLHNGQAQVAQPDMTLHVGDVVHLVGPKAGLERLKFTIGRESKTDVKAIPGNITTRRIVVTHAEVFGKSIDELDLVEKYGVVITRVARADQEIAAQPDWDFQFGDTVLAVGNVEAIDRVAALLGNSPKKLEHPHMIPIFIGLALGVFIGSCPIPVGLSAPVKLGLAGGPLLIAIIFARIGQVGHLTWYMSRSANLLMREFGIVLFLACVGLVSGPKFLSTLVSGPGVYWMVMAAFITAVPMLLVGFIGRAFMKLNYVSLCGLLAGSMTDPPALAFANQMTQSENPAVTYAMVYPLTMILRIITTQAIILLFWSAM
ncbi:MAG: putative transporter [Phycisphaerae bacterium]